MSERTMWVRLRKVLQPYGDLVRVENPVHPGTPDVNYCFDGDEGWIELKEVETPNDNKKGIFEIKHFTPQQRVWLRRRWKHGGRAFLFLHIVSLDYWMLFDGDVAAEYVGRVSYHSTTLRARIGIIDLARDVHRLVTYLRTASIM